MPRSHSSWKGSASCRLEWRPSRWVATIQIVLGLLAVCSLAASGLSGWLVVGMSALVIACAGWSTRRYLRRPCRQLVISGGAQLPMLDGSGLCRLSVQWRGPLAFAAWQDVQGASGHLAWWPDTLDLRQRRELRLAADRLSVSPDVASMAP